ncbi:unnamed protein product [Rotaria sordida]|uniref:Uncharacterized protein n=2 Tax=Rotaria sordida TaxID=392033 RepID=A0A819MDK8_9BILA|nr:unnamed protein product [Rotaria sordida]
MHVKVKHGTHIIFTRKCIVKIFRGKYYVIPSLITFIFACFTKSSVIWISLLFIGTPTQFKLRFVNYCSNMVGFDARNRDTVNPLNISSEIFNLTVTLDEYKQEECTKIDVLCTLKKYGCFDLFNSYNNKCNDDTQRLSSESIRLQSSIEYDVKSNQEKLQQDVASSKPNIDDIPYVSYNETLIWKITSFHGKKSKFNLKKKEQDCIMEKDDSVFRR